ncbi:MAG: NADAR family protein [Candidatus Paceibacterota bacterium]|jgi:hypothetical protein
MSDILPLEIFYIYFSPYTSHAIDVDGTLYPTVEHAYQCARYTDQNIREEIRTATSPVKAWQISCKYKHLQIPEFREENHKRKVMKELMRKKMEQHEEVREALKNTGSQKIIKRIVTYPPGDGYWDIGADGKGENEIGKIWMELREEINIHTAQK